MRALCVVLALFLACGVALGQARVFVERDFDKAWNFGDPAGTERAFREMLTKAPDEAYRLELLTQIARALGLQKKFDEAHRVLDEVEKASAGDRVRVRYLLERGRAFNSSGSKEKARPLFLQAWELGQKAKEDALAVDAAHMMGIVEAGQASLDWNMKAIELAKKSPEPRAQQWQGSLLNNTGWTYHDMGEFEKALALFRDALAFREQAGVREPILIARWCVGRALRSLKRYDEALAIQKALLEEHKKDGSDDPYVQEEMGELLHVLGREEEAVPHFAAAYRALSKDDWLVKNEPARIERLKRLGRVG